MRSNNFFDSARMLRLRLPHSIRFGAANAILQEMLNRSAKCELRRFTSGESHENEAKREKKKQQQLENVRRVLCEENADLEGRAVSGGALSACTRSCLHGPAQTGGQAFAAATPAIRNSQTHNNNNNGNDEIIKLSKATS